MTKKVTKMQYHVNSFAILMGRGFILFLTHIGESRKQNPENPRENFIWILFPEITLGGIPKIRAVREGNYLVGKFAV